MQLPYLVRAVASHAEVLANELIAELRLSPETPAMSLLTDDELRWRILDLYSNLGHWLESRAADEVREAYRHLGARRCQEGVPAAELIFSLIAAKRHLWDFIRRNALTDTVTDFYQLEELEGALNHFFDLALYSGVQGHESARQAGMWNATPMRGSRAQYPGVPAGSVSIL